MDTPTGFNDHNWGGTSNKWLVQLFRYF